MKTEMEFKSEALSSFLTKGFTIAGDIVTPVDVSEKVPSKSDWDAKIAELKAEYDALAWKRSRQAEYPSVGDQLDMLMKDMKNNTTTHREACEAVKLKYPKPE